MPGFVLRRLLQAAVILIGVTMLTFFLFQFLPGGEADAILGPKISPEVRHAFIHQQGLDRSLPAQYLGYLGRLLHGDLGYSYKQGQSVGSILTNAIPKSLVLVGVSLTLALLIGITVGLFQATRRSRIEDHLLTAGAFTLYAMPDFFLALVLVDIFAIRLHWVPPLAPTGDSWTAAFSHPQAMILPVATYSLTIIAVFSRYARSTAVNILRQDFIRTARAKGAGSVRVLTHHTVRNVCVPIITLLGLSFPALFSGAIIIEEVFNYPGVGLAAYNAALNKDYALLLGVLVIVGAATVMGNLLADIAYAYADPRVRYS